MKLNQKQSDTVEKLANYFLRERLPIDVIDSRDNSVIIPAKKLITKKDLRKIVLCGEFATTETRTPISNKIKEIITNKYC
jgi:hypothetical protein